MKRVVAMLLAVVICMGVVPASVFAIETEDEEFNQFLQETGWEKQAYIDYLEEKDWYLDDFESVDELGTPLTEESVQPVLDKYVLTREELNSLLVEYGDIEEGQDVLEGSWIIFSEELDLYVDFYLNGWEGTLIDEQNLQELLDWFEFDSKEELEGFLQEYGDSIENYEYIEDLEWAVDYYLYEEDYFSELFLLFEEFGLTEKEVERLAAHLETLDYEDPAFSDKLLELSDRMLAFEDFETADELSAEEIAELLDIYQDFLDLFQMEAKFYLVKDGDKQALSLQTMMTMTSTNGFDLLIELYDKQGAFLADILLTAEMFGSDLIKETGEDIKQAEEIVTTKPEPEAVKKVEKSTSGQTVKGGQLPKTAGDYAQHAMFGLALTGLGLFLFRRSRKWGGSAE
ncbi:processed acidic surface protein [Sediminibacillus massiliensis]|uniref:processed acidic surface protein n=1 Tax=Sediminibacillus massiliensis TaxID=1926277 RepID=UPI00098889F5|nr:processed acidic surface protein [Sediminibacillus massiliensis]